MRMIKIKSIKAIKSTKKIKSIKTQKVSKICIFLLSSIVIGRARHFLFLNTRFKPLKLEKQLKSNYKKPKASKSK